MARHSTKGNILYLSGVLALCKALRTVQAGAPMQRERAAKMLAHEARRIQMAGEDEHLASLIGAVAERLEASAAWDQEAEASGLLAFTQRPGPLA